MDSLHRPIQHVVIVESNADGHRLSYVADLARCALDRGYRVTLVVPVGAPQIQVHLGDLATRCEVVPHDGRQSLSGLSRQLSSDLLVIPDGDRVAVSLGLRPIGRRAWTGRGVIRILLMRWGHGQRDPSVISRGRQLIKRAAVRRALRYDGVELIALASATGAGTTEGFSLAPDPVRISADAQMSEGLRVQWGATDSRPVIAIVGAIDRRKNLPIVLDALSMSNRMDIVLVIAGRVDSSVLDEITPKVEALRASGYGLIVHNRTLSDQELDSTIVAADYVVLAHSNEGPSGILGKAMAVGTGIIAAGADSLKRDVDRLGRNLDTWCALSPGSLAAVLNGVGVHDHSARICGPGSDEFAAAVLGFSYG